jgi:Zn ribbon nucleic-acid-binding protein
MNKEPIYFQCPTCEARHTRGFFNGVDMFRCMGCGYQGHGFHSDPEIDRAVYSDHVVSNANLRLLGLPETPLGIDPLSHGN